MSVLSVNTFTSIEICNQKRVIPDVYEKYKHCNSETQLIISKQQRKKLQVPQV